MYFGTIGFARLFGHDLLCFHIRNTLVYPAYRLILFHGLDVHNDFRVGDIEQLCAPSVLNAQRIVRHRKDRRFHTVDHVLVRLKRDFFRLYPFEQFIVRKTACFPLVKTAGMAVFKKHSRFAFAEQLGTQPALIDLRRHVDCRIFQIQFVSAIQHDIIIGYVLFPDIVQAVDGVDALAQNTVFDRLHIVRIHTLTNVVQPPEKFACEGVQIYGAVDFYDVRALIAVDKF